MQYRHLFPMVRILLPFMAGIIVSVALSAAESISYSIWTGLMLLTFGAEIISFRRPQFFKRLFFGILASLFLFVSGFNSVLLHKEILRPDHFSKKQTQGLFIAEVSEPLQPKEHSYKTILKVKGIINGKTVNKVEGRILTYFSKDSTYNLPGEGSTILFSGLVQNIGSPQNPGAFDYQRYMGTNNVYHQLFLNNKSWKLIENPHGFSLFRFAHKISDKFVHILNSNGLKGKEFAVASALLLGQKDMLDNETRQAYSGSGVMHILCVSGLHVGVIFFIVNFLLRFMKKKRWQVYLKTFLILLSIWAYALLTGLSPSVMRAAAMFTFITFGNASNRYVHIINSLSVSALVLLLYDPLMISNVGFQLSYIAILGIIFINKLINDLWEPTNRIMEHIWGLVTVSVAAQITTAPLAMLYFHQFPLYFIPANLVAIDISFLAILSGLAVLITSFVPFISNLFGVITNFLIYLINTSVNYIEHLPYSVIHFDSIFTKEMLLIYMIIASCTLYVYFKRKELIHITLLLILLLSVSLTITETLRQKQQKIIFYSTNNQSAVGFIIGQKQILLADSILIKDKTANKFQLDGARLLYGIKRANILTIDTAVSYYQMLPEEFRPLRYLGNNILFHNKRIVFIDSIPRPDVSCKKLKTDYLVIRHNAKFRIADLQRLYQPGLIIIDGSNTSYKTEKWLTEFRQAGLKAYSLKNSGAYIVDL